MPRLACPPTPSLPDRDPPLSSECLNALRSACAPAGVLRFPPLEVIRTLRRCGYVQIVLGGIETTPLGLERLLRERRKALSAEMGRTGALR